MGQEVDSGALQVGSPLASDLISGGCPRSRKRRKMRKKTERRKMRKRRRTLSKALVPLAKG